MPWRHPAQHAGQRQCRFEGHPQFGGEEMHYGEAVITLPYVKQNWTELFDLLDVSILSGDMYQVALTLRKK